jgi:flavorubredoxin
MLGDRVYRLGGDVTLDGRLSWVPPAVTGRQPANCYLIRTADGAALIDTGVRIHASTIVGQLRHLLEPETPVDVVLTRTEMDCCLNIPAMAEHITIRGIHYTGGITVPRTDAEVRRICVAEGTPSRVSLAGGIELIIHAPRLRLLPTLWPYDPVSRTLFTSDSFCHNRGPGDVTADDVLLQLRTKFSWLEGTATEAVEQDLRTITHPDGKPVRAIAPGHGYPFIGEEAVARQVDLLSTALGEVGR